MKIFSHFPAFVVGAVACFMARGALGATVAAPVFNPPAGTYNDTVDVAITSATAGAVIYYTTDGTEPTAVEENLYDPDLAPTLEEDTTVKAIAVKEGSTDSAITTGDYKVVDTTPAVTVATPKFSPAAGKYNDHVTVTMTTTTPGATIYYTTDGTNPTLENSETYDADSPPEFDETTTVKAFATGDSDDTDSAIATATYEVIDTTPAITVATPKFSPAAGAYNDVVNVTLTTTTPDATIYYTLDGTDPSADNGEEYDGSTPIQLTEDTTVKAIAVRKGDTDSAIATAAYTVIDNPPITVAAPVFKPGAGRYYDFVEVAMSSTTPGAKIYYTTDGTVPTGDPDNDFLYEAGFPEFVAETEVIKAIAVRTGDNSSPVTSGKFTVLPLPAPKLKVKGKAAFTVTKPIVKISGTSTFADEVTFLVGKGKKFKAANGVSPWKIKAKLKPGLNVITIVAVGLYEDSKPKKLKVTYTPATK